MLLVFPRGLLFFFRPWIQLCPRSFFRFVGRRVSPNGKEDSRHLPHERDDRDASTPAQSDLFGPDDHRIVWPCSPRTPCGLNENPANFARPSLRDGGDPFLVGAGVFARGNTQVRLDLVSAREARDLVERGEESDSADLTDTGNGHQSAAGLVGLRDLGELFVGLLDLLVERIESQEETLDVDGDARWLFDESLSDSRWKALESAGSQLKPSRSEIAADGVDKFRSNLDEPFSHVAHRLEVSRSLGWDVDRGEIDATGNLAECPRVALVCLDASRSDAERSGEHRWNDANFVAERHRLVGDVKGLGACLDDHPALGSSFQITAKTRGWPALLVDDFSLAASYANLRFPSA